MIKLIIYNTSWYFNVSLYTSTAAIQFKSKACIFSECLDGSDGETFPDQLGIWWNAISVRSDGSKTKSRPKTNSVHFRRYRKLHAFVEDNPIVSCKTDNRQTLSGRILGETYFQSPEGRGPGLWTTQNRSICFTSIKKLHGLQNGVFWLLRRPNDALRSVYLPSN